MPIKWDPAQDQRLLLKILETHPDLKLNVNAVAEAWPVGENEAKPTPRAIRERLVKIRETHKKAGGVGHFSIGKARPASKTAAATNGVKPSARGKPTPVTPKKQKKNDPPIKTERSELSPDSNSDPASPTRAYPTPSSSFSQTIPAHSYHHSLPPSFMAGASSIHHRSFRDADEASASDDDNSYTRTGNIQTRDSPVLSQQKLPTAIVAAATASPSELEPPQYRQPWYTQSIHRPDISVPHPGAPRTGVSLFENRKASAVFALPEY